MSPLDMSAKVDGESRQDSCGFGGAEGDRTPDLMSAIHALSQLSYSPDSGCAAIGAAASCECECAST